MYRSVELGTRPVAIGEKMLDKQDEHTRVLTEFRDQTQQSFGVLDVKYGAISENMGRVIEEMREERKNRWID